MLVKSIPTVQQGILTTKCQCYMKLLIKYHISRYVKLIMMQDLIINSRVPNTVTP